MGNIDEQSEIIHNFKNKMFWETPDKNIQMNLI